MVGVGAQTAHLDKYKLKPHTKAHSYCLKWAFLLFFFSFVASLHNTIETKPTHILYIPTKCLSSGLQTCSEWTLTKKT